MTSRPSAAAASSSSSSTSATASPSLGAPPIRLRHPLPAPPLQCAPPPPSRTRSLKSPRPPPSSSSSSTYSTLRTSPRYSYPTNTSSASPSTSPYYSSSHPSPAPSNTSSAGGSSGSATSSLRTPPDLLINGSSVAHKGAHQLAVNTWNGLAVKPRQARNLRQEEIKKRQSLLAGLPNLSVLQLPSPPPSPKLVAADRTDRKRRRASVDDQADPLPSAPQRQSRPSTVAQHPPSTLASAYRTAARSLKHAADARASTLSATHPSYLAARPTHISALEQLDAALLFCYAFWLDDLSSSSGCITKNWTSLFGLLRYATNAHSDLGNDVCLGVCRLVEAAVLRKLHAHDTTLLLRMLDKQPSVEELAQMIHRQTADLERSDRLAAQARNLLSVNTLSATHPELLAKALASTVGNTEAGARAVDPSSEQSCASCFAWPLDSCSAMPHLVAFGRCAVGEQARRLRVGFEVRTVVVDE